MPKPIIGGTAHQVSGQFATIGRAPADFQNASPFPRSENGKDPVGGLASLLFSAA